MKLTTKPETYKKKCIEKNPCSIGHISICCDLAAVSLNYTEDAKLFPANSEIIEGRETIKAFWGGAAEMGVRKVNLETTTADGFGNNAIEEGKRAMEKLQPYIDKSGEMMTFKSKYTD